MKFRIRYTTAKNEDQINPDFLSFFYNEKINIEGTELIKKWENKNGDIFIAIGEIIGERIEGFKLAETKNWSLLEENTNISLFEGRFIIIKVSNKDEISVWADQFGRTDIYWYDSGKGEVIITSGMDLFPENINFGKIDQNALAQLFTLYGSRPLKKDTLHENINRLGVQELINITEGNLNIKKRPFIPKNSFPTTNDKLKLEEYSNIFIESVRARMSKTQNIIFLSSGWDSTSILATLAHLTDASNIDCIIGRMNYSERSETINQFEIDRAQKMADYYNVNLHLIELDYIDNGEEIFKEVSPVLKSQEFASITGVNHWLLAKGAKKIAKSGAVVFAGEISDGAHNLGFSQYVSIYHSASHSFREYSDKMATYLFGPTFLSQLINGVHEEDPVWKIFKSYNQMTKFDTLKKGKVEITSQLFRSFFLSGGRIPLYSKDNCKILTKEGRALFLSNGEKTYLKDFEGKIEASNLYSYYIHLYHSFHWQGGTVATLEHVCDAFGLKCRLPFLDKAMIDFFSEMPESWGRGLDINKTKFPLKWMLSNRIDYPMHFQEGPHSYLYDINPSFSHSDELVNASSLSNLFKEVFRKEDFLRFFNSKYFNIKYIKIITSKFLSGEEVKGQELTDILNLGNFLSLKIIQ
tara:strand:+ start:17873 stop:19786 length:1914 start_codon:yes stop_codon:yes gene_type:complete